MCRCGLRIGNVHMIRLVQGRLRSREIGPTYLGSCCTFLIQETITFAVPSSTVPTFSRHINEDCARCSSLHIHVEPRLPEMDVFFFSGICSRKSCLSSSSPSYLLSLCHSRRLPSSCSLSAYLVNDRAYMYMAFSGMPQDTGTCNVYSGVAPASSLVAIYGA